MNLQYLRNECRYGWQALLRDGFINRQYLKKLQRYETYCQQDLQLLQQRWLHKTLLLAISRLTFYKNINNRFTEQQALDVLTRYFPIIEKSDLLKHRAKLYPNGGRHRPWYALGRTSGTTGSPLTVFRSPHSVCVENAFVKRHWHWHGFYEGMKRATLRGDMVVSLSQESPPFWHYNRYNKQLVISSRHLKDRFMGIICDQLEKFSPSMLQAYPSTAYTLAQYLERHDRYLNIPLVFTSSEPLYIHQRELIQSRFHARVRDMYGMAERVAMITECEFGEMHVNSDYSYVEIVDSNGNPTLDYGYLVGTTLHNYAMPLIRYKLSDMTKWKPGLCKCGRHFPMVETIGGKYEDLIFDNDGAPVSPSVLTFAFKGIANVLKSQVAQIANNQWEVRVVPSPAFSELDQRQIIYNIHHHVAPDIKVRVVTREELPNTASGKFRWVVNEVSRK